MAKTYRRLLPLGLVCFATTSWLGCDADRDEEEFPVDGTADELLIHEPGQELAPEGPDARIQPTATEQSLGTPPVYEGRFATRIIDYLDGTSATFHVLKKEGEAISIKLPAGVEIERDALVQVWGDYNSDGALVVDAHEVVGPPALSQRSINPSFNPAKRVAFVSLTWEGEGGTGISKEEADSKVFTGATSTNNYYQEISYGREKIVGQAFGPYAIPKPNGCGDLNDPLGTEKISLEARRAVKEEYPNAEAEFQQFMYHIPNWGACAWGGLAEVGSREEPARDSWYNGSSGCVVLAQELGHNYGMGHSHSFECQGGPYSDDCDFTEYGHPYDPMGHGCGHMNQVQKGYMGYLDECNVVTATADGTFNLMPTELPCDGPQTVRVATGTVDPQNGDPLYYYLEYRQPIGQFDDPGGSWGQGLSGVLVHVGNLWEDFEYYPRSYVLNMGPGRFLHEGDSYADHDGLVTINVLEENSTHAVIDLSFPGGGSGDPSCLDDSVPVTEEGNYGTLECAATPIQPDLTAPTVEITYPQDGDVIDAGSSFDITVDAQDAHGIAYVQLYVDSAPFFKQYDEGPYAWGVENIPVGTYELGAVASDGPNWTPSEVVTFTVAEPDEDPGETGEDGGDEDTGDDGGDTDDDGGTDDDAGAEPTADEKGCGCDVSGAEGTPSRRGIVWSSLALGVGMFWRRRRRPR